jgi:hypothetical protein
MIIYTLILAKSNSSIYNNRGMIDNAQNYEHMILGSEDDSKWIVYVPELAGCMADGDTSTQALENVERVIED